MTTMFYIHHKPVFEKRSGCLSGYEMFITRTKEDARIVDMDVLGFEDRGGEYDRIRCMLRQREDFNPEDSEFVDKSPIEIVNYVRGVATPPRKTSNWKEEVDNWKINLRGERV